MRTVADYEALTGADALMPAEKKLIAAVRAGQPCALQDEFETVPEADNNPAHTIRADLLALLITGGTPACGLSPFGVRLLGAYVTGTLRLTHLRAVGDTVLVYCRFAEKPDLRNAHFQTLNLTGSHLPGLIAQGVDVRADLFLRSIIAAGTVEVNGAMIAGQLSCNGATLKGAGGMALHAQGAEVGGHLFLRGINATGVVDLGGATIGGQLVCRGASFDGAGDAALDAQRARVTQAFIWQGVSVTSGHVVLAATHVGDLWDDVSNWPDDVDLDGFTYERLFNTTTSAQKRLPWLKKGSVFEGTFTPQPYTHLAKVLREMGHDREAREVLMARNEILAREDLIAGYRKANGKPYLRFENPWKDLKYLAKWGLDLCLRYGVGYGYAPQRAAYVLIALIGLAWGMSAMTWHKGAFAPNSDVILVSQGWQDQLQIDCQPLYFATCVENPAKAWSNDAANGMDWDSFHALGYAVDLVIPILNLGQTEAWAPSKDRGPWGLYLWWGRWVLIAAGWIISALGAAALTGIMQRDKDR